MAESALVKKIKIESQDTSILNKFLLTNEDIGTMQTEFNEANYLQIKQKIRSIKKYININHKINLIEKKYNNIYITSDIHADVRKFYQILKQGNFIESSFEPYNDDIYEPNIITKTKWTQPNCLFIIVGDLIDGKRELNSVDDRYGSFEIILHLLIYNLRIQALQMNSDILFTFGNHDYITLLDITDNKYMYRNLIHETAFNYFNITQPKGIYKNIMTQRIYALRVFYELSPYIYLELDIPNQSPIICVHAGLHENNINNLSEIKKAQEIINNQNNISELYKHLKKPNDKIYEEYYKYFNNIIKVTNVRDYASKLDNSYCDLINRENAEYSMIVVGHCPTNNNFDRIKNIMNTNVNMYKSCDISNETSIINNTGCIVLDCYSKNKKGDTYKLGFVDVGMSNSFRRELNVNEYNKDRNIELLKISLDTDTKKVSISKLKIQMPALINMKLSEYSYQYKYLKYKNKYLELRSKYLNFYDEF